MKFSQKFGIEKTDEDDWFDPVLRLDTPLFLDPFLLYKQEFGPFVGSHAEIIEFFDSVFKLIAKSKGNNDTISWKKARNCLIFPEMDELCLGYSSGSTRGAGSGLGFSRSIAQALWEAVEAGLEDIEHFEEVGILREGIGPDRISDMTANIIAHRLVKYTEEVCKSHGIVTEEIRFRSGRFDPGGCRWEPISGNLPVNPYSGGPILLVPQRYLNDLPTINADDFWDWSYHNYGDIIRTEFSDDVGRRVSKHAIVEFARRHPDIRRKYLDAVEKRKPQPYDFEADPLGVVQWLKQTAQFFARNPKLLQDFPGADPKKFLDALVDRYRHFIEQKGGWRLLWNEDDSPKRENASQLAFLGIAMEYCRVHNVDLTREAEVGRGPVDFKFSQGLTFRALLEVKKANNSKFWNGVEKQLPAYMVAEEVDIGFFLVIVLSEKDEKRIPELKERVKAINDQVDMDIYYGVVDAQPKDSASKL